MASDYYNPSANDKYVADGDTCYADDLNKVNNAANAGFELVESDVDAATATAIENAGLSKEWAANDQGDLPSNPAGDPPNTDKYSSKANAIEAEDWASASDGSFDPGDTINLAAGGTTTHPSAKTSADHAETQADLAEAAKVIAVAAKDSAIAQNSILATDPIVITSVGTAPDPIEFTVGLRTAEQITTPASTADVAFRNNSADNTLRFMDKASLVDFLSEDKTFVDVSRASSQTLVTGSSTVFIFNTETVDRLGEYNTTTGRFTPSNNGVYLFSSSMIFNRSTWPYQKYTQMRVVVNGVVKSIGPVWSSVVSASIDVSCNITVALYLETTDYVEIAVYQNTGTNLNSYPSSYLNWLTITRAA